MFSNVGIPPLAGFFTKFLVVFHLLTMHHILSAVFILFMSALSAFYYLRVIRILTSNLDLYFDVVNSYSFSSLFFLFFINLPNFLFLAALNPFFTFTLTFSCNFLV
jgi:NADH-quinone oxidoreductase subunit N